MSRQHFLEDRQRARGIHLQEAVERRDAQIIVIVLARAVPSARTASVGRRQRMPSDPLGGFSVPLLCQGGLDRKSTRLNSRHMSISYAVFCLKKKKKKPHRTLHSTHNKKKKTQNTHYY